MGTRDELIEQAETLIKSGDSAAALGPIDEILKTNDRDGQAWFYRGCALSNTGRREEAVVAYCKSIGNAPTPAHAMFPLFNLGNTLQDMGQPDEALQCFVQVTEIQPDHTAAWINRGRLVDDAGRHEEAITCYDTALKLAPEDAVAWSNRGNSLKALKKHHDAVESYRQALNIDVHDFASLAGVAECMVALNELDRALAWLDTAIRANDQPHFHCEKSRVLMKLGRREDALASIDQSIASGVRVPQVYNNRGEILGKMERLEESLAAFDEVLRLQPDYLPAIFGKARVLVYHKRHAEARPLLTQYFSLAAPNHDLHEAAMALAGLAGMGKGGKPMSEN